MEPWAQMVITVICAVLASGGFWSFLQSRHDRNNTERDMLRGLGHDRIMQLGSFYIERGYITTDEFENLHDYLYVPYRKLGGNGTAEKIMKEVSHLPTSIKK